MKSEVWRRKRRPVPYPNEYLKGSMVRVIGLLCKYRVVYSMDAGDVLPALERRHMIQRLPGADRMDLWAGVQWVDEWQRFLHWAKVQKAGEPIIPVLSDRVFLEWEQSREPRKRITDQRAWSALEEFSFHPRHAGERQFRMISHIKNELYVDAKATVYTENGQVLTARTPRLIQPPDQRTLVVLGPLLTPLFKQFAEYYGPGPRFPGGPPIHLRFLTGKPQILYLSGMTGMQVGAVFHKVWHQPLKKGYKRMFYWHDFSKWDSLQGRGSNHLFHESLRRAGLFSPQILGDRGDGFEAYYAFQKGILHVIPPCKYSNQYKGMRFRAKCGDYAYAPNCTQFSGQWDTTVGNSKKHADVARDAMESYSFAILAQINSLMGILGDDNAGVVDTPNTGEELVNHMIDHVTRLGLVAVADHSFNPHKAELLSAVFYPANNALGEETWVLAPKIGRAGLVKSGSTMSHTVLPRVGETVDATSDKTRLRWLASWCASTANWAPKLPVFRAIWQLYHRFCQNYTGKLVQLTREHMIAHTLDLTEFEVTEQQADWFMMRRYGLARVEWRALEEQILDTPDLPYFLETTEAIKVIVDLDCQ